MTRTILLPLFVLAATLLQAQQLSLFTQYRENATIINPAALESDFFAFGQNLTFGASYRAQWVGLDNAPTTATIRGSYVNKDASGAGILAGGYIINDQTGPTGFTGIYGRIGAVISGDPEFNGFSVALSGGYVQYRLDASEITLRDPNDILGTQDQTQWYPDLGFGLFFYQSIGRFGNDYFYAGLSVPQILGLDLTFLDDNGDFFIQRVQHFYGQLGIYKFFDNDSFIEPSVWVKYVSGADINVDVNLRYQMPSNIWIGTGVSSAGIVHVEGGFNLGDAGYGGTGFRIGYGFDYSFSDFGPSAGSTHEINLTYSIDR